MKKAMIYPFGRESEFIVEHNELLQELNPICLVGLKGWDKGQREYCVNNDKIPLVYDFEKAIDDYASEVVWFVDFSTHLDFKTEYLPFIKLACEKEKKIILSKNLNDMAKDYITDLPIKFYRSYETKMDKKKNGEFLKPINTPIVYICSLYRDLCEFDFQLMVRKELKKRNVSFIQIGTKDVSKEFGFFDVPWFMVDDNVSDKEKTLMFNRYIKELEETERPELIIIGVPGEMCAVSENYVAGFGYLARDYFYAVKPDVVGMLLPYDLYLESDLHYISEMVRNRFGVPVDVFCRTNKHMQLSDTELEQKCIYLTVNKNDMKENPSKENIYDLEKEQVSKLVSAILNKLKSYGSVDSI